MLRLCMICLFASDIAALEKRGVHDARTHPTLHKMAPHAVAGRDRRETAGLGAGWRDRATPGADRGRPDGGSTAEILFAHRRGGSASDLEKTGYRKPETGEWRTRSRDHWRGGGGDFCGDRGEEGRAEVRGLRGDGNFFDRRQFSQGQADLYLSDRDEARGRAPIHRGCEG